MPKSYLKKIEKNSFSKNIIFLSLIFIIITLWVNQLLLKSINNNNSKINIIDLEILDYKYTKSEDISNRLITLENNILLISNANKEILNNKFDIEKTLLVILNTLDNNVLLESITFSKENESILLYCVTDSNLYSDDFIAKLNKYYGFKKVSLIDFENSNKIYFTIEIVLNEDEGDTMNYYE